MPVRPRIPRAPSKAAAPTPAPKSIVNPGSKPHPPRSAPTQSSSSSPRLDPQARSKPSTPPIFDHVPPSSSSTPPSKPKSTRITHLHQMDRPRRVITLLGGGFLGLIAIYVAGYGYTVYREYERSSSLDADSIPRDTSSRYNAIANDFDATVDSQERLIGISGKRKKLCALARGHVLEASCGTGRNSTFWPLADRERGPDGVRSITMVDKSREMLDVARLKWPECGNAWFINAVFRVADLGVPGARVPVPSAARPENGGSGKFDTIVQTMGVCSTGEPVQVLKNLGDMCEEENGRILLLEHGRGTWDIVNRVLDGLAPGHAERYGCWFNKDIGRIVRDSGLEIVEEERSNFGTTWWYVLKPSKKPKQEHKVEEPAEKVVDRARGWSTWWK